ncbi:F-box protein At5g46170-like [Phragmites australis]|uniref:F-box protein At5g46170-like n=1 Tax=Phragmites australis TaxID=29695 RepID=UPI002D798D77|nr:F-box protein At5g46170-like [Phragmites australis]XP_062207001.1 F-box protein At5g46170-like [Phragmites australis]
MEGEGEQDGCPCGAVAADQFDRLPDAVLMDVFNRIGNVKALGRCALVSRRFHALVPLVDSVFVRVDCVIPDDLPQPPGSAGSQQQQAAVPPARGHGALAQLARLVLGGIARPIQALVQILSPAAAAVSRRSAPQPASPPAPASDVSHHSPSEVLRPFKELRRLHIELPTGELGIDDGVLLKWKADFGSTLGSCVILGALSVSSKPPSPSTSPETAADSSANSADSNREPEESGSLPESLFTNGGLKLRVVWTISSLIAASARHYLLQSIIADHAMLGSLNLTDSDGQGVLTMDKRQLQELRVRPISASASSHRTLMPALSMRLYYAPHVELPGGTLLKGATLVAIRPSEDSLREGGGAGAAGPAGTCWISDAFEEPYRTAAKVLLKRRAYCLEMNSF